MTNFKTTGYLLALVGASGAWAGTASLCDRMSSIDANEVYHTVTPETVDLAVCARGNTLMHEAAIGGNLPAAAELLDIGASVTIPNADGLTAVAMAQDAEVSSILQDAADEEGHNAPPADDDGSDGGWYAGAEGIFPFKKDTNHIGSDTDVPTNCDQHIPGALSLSDARCTRSADAWEGSNTLVGETDAAFQVGYEFGERGNGLRVEAEYFTRTAVAEDPAGQSLNLVSGGKQQELIMNEDNFSNVRGRHFMVNAFYDKRVDYGSVPVSYFAGGGVGVGHNTFRYSGIWGRNFDADFIESIGRVRGAAGRTTRTIDDLEDTQLTGQVAFGARFWARDNVAIVAKGRYVRYIDDFSASAPWDSLRGHASTVGPEGTQVPHGDNSVIYTKTIEGRDQSYWSASLGVQVGF